MVPEGCPGRSNAYHLSERPGDFRKLVTQAPAWRRRGIAGLSCLLRHLGNPVVHLPQSGHVTSAPACSCSRCPGGVSTAVRRASRRRGTCRCRASSRPPRQHVGPDLVRGVSVRLHLDDRQLHALDPCVHHTLPELRDLLPPPNDIAVRREDLAGRRVVGRDGSGVALREVGGEPGVHRLDGGFCATASPAMRTSPSAITRW